MPTSMSESGMCSTVPSRANTGGKQENVSTIARISQTWLASQIGPMAWLITSRWRSRRGPVASRSHTPPPKSAPPNSTYALRETAISPARITGSVMSDGTAHPSRRVHAAPFGGPRASDDLAVEQPGHHRAEEAVERGEAEERYDEARHRCHRVGRPEHAVDDPGLPPDLRHRPPRLDGDEPHRRREREGAEEPGAGAQVPAPECQRTGPDANQRHEGAEADHELEGRMDDRDVRPVRARDLIQSLHLGVEVVEREEREPAGNPEGVPGLAGGHVGPAADHERHPPPGLEVRLHRGELGRLVLGDRAGTQVA